MVRYDMEDRITSLENDRKQMQPKLENLQYTITLLEKQLKNDYDKQNKEIYENLYFIIMVCYRNINICVICYSLDYYFFV